MHQTFVLTPYKLVSAHFLSKYLDWRMDSRLETTQIHLQIAFQLIMSLDLSFGEMMNIVQKSIVLNRNHEESDISQVVESVENEFLDDFKKSLPNLTTIDSLSSFIDRIDFSRDAADKEWAESMRKQCHSKSLIGMFLRRIVVHFKRLSFNEVTMLVHNIYAYVRTMQQESPRFVHTRNTTRDSFRFPEVCDKNGSLSSDQEPQRLADISIERLETIEKKLHSEYQNQSFSGDRKGKIELENKIILVSKIIKEKHAYQVPAETVQQQTDTDMAVSKDNTSMMEEDTTIEQLNDNNNGDKNLEGEHKKIPNYITQQYLVNQVNMILANEKRSLPPEEILKLVDHFYKKHNSFQYQQAIHSNYRMNVRMGVKSSQLDSASSLTNSESGHGNDIANIFSKRFGDVHSSNNFHNDLYYLKFINALRMNDYPSAQESLHRYFDHKDFTFSPNFSNDPFSKNNLNKKRFNNGDGNTPSGQGANNCWALLNIGIMHAHFRHFELAYDALENCVRIARDCKDNKCLQFQMIWMLHVLEQMERPQSVTTEVNSSQTRFWKLFNSVFDDINHEKGLKITAQEYFVTSNLMKLISINERKLPYIAAMGYLHLEKQLYKQPIRASERRQPLKTLLSVEKQLSSSYLRPPINIKPLLLASRYMMDDVLQKQYSMHSALLNAYGAHHLAVITSKLLARMDFSGVLEEKKYAHCNENHAIAFRNIAFYHWKVAGDSESALECLKFFENFVSEYDKTMKTIISSAMIDIQYDICLFSADWSNALSHVQTMRCYSPHYSAILLSKLKFLRGNKMDALRCLESVIGDEELSRIPQNVEHNEMLLKSFKKTKTTIKVSETSQKNKKLKFVLPSSGSKSKYSNKKKNSKIEDDSETIIIQNPKTKLAVLSPELDPFMWLYASLLKAQMNGNPFDLLQIIQYAQNYGFKQIEIKAELEIITIQQRDFGQYYESQERIDDLIVKILSSGIQEDIAKAYYLSAVNHYFIHRDYKLNESDADRAKKYLNDYRQLPLRMGLNCDINQFNYHIHIARWTIMRATSIYYRLQHKNGISDSTYLGRIIERTMFDDVHSKKYGKNVPFGTQSNDYEKRFVFYTKLANIIGPVCNSERL